MVAELGYDNTRFLQGFLEEIPLETRHADVVISNCVINLSPDKRTTFHEIYRILNPAGAWWSPISSPSRHSADHQE